MKIRFIFSVLLLFLLSTCKSEIKVKDNCGDDLVDPDEQCDGTNLAGQTCESLGHYNVAGALGCLADCTFDRADCGGRCGDDVIDVPEGEACDGIDFNGESCTTMGYHGGYLQCTESCELITTVCEDTGSCGDGVVQATYEEECDSDDLAGESCESLGFTEGTLACSETCGFDRSGCMSGCGNGLVEVGEDCDDGNAEPEDGCDSACAVENGWDCTEDAPTVCTPICGDGQILGEETCEGIDLGDATCGSLGFAGGTLACDSGCRLDTAGCDRWLAVDAGGAHTCAIAADRSLWCWGENQYGQLGTGNTTDSPVPVAVSGMDSGVLEVSAGLDHTCAMKSGGAVSCWGNNVYGQLGTGDRGVRTTPAAVNDFVFNTISAGSSFTCGVKNDNRAACWGYNFSSQCGFVGNNTDLPSGIGITNLVSVACGGSHALAINTGNLIHGWGSNSSGQLGNNSTAAYVLPTSVGANARTAAPGDSHSCIINTSGGVSCTGDNTKCQLGRGGACSGFQAIHQVITGLISGVLALASGGSTTCAVKGDGSVHCWGLNDHGQLGDNTLQNRSVPTQVTGLAAGVSRVSVGKSHVCALSDAGTLTCWGENEDGRLGDGTTTDHLTPVFVDFGQ